MLFRTISERRVSVFHSFTQFLLNVWCRCQANTETDRQKSALFAVEARRADCRRRPLVPTSQYQQLYVQQQEHLCQHECPPYPTASDHTQVVALVRSLPAINAANNEKNAQRDANTARALAVVRFGHRPPPCPPATKAKGTNAQTHKLDRLQYTAPLASAQCNEFSHHSIHIMLLIADSRCSLLQATWEELAGKVAHRDQLIIC